MESKNSALPDCYQSIKSPSEGIYKDKGSKFLSFAYPVESEEEIKTLISHLKKEYYDARHHCYAYRLGHLGDTWRFNDDGEPSSTAGKPIYGQLLSNNLSDILIVVVRYFGGTKLGVPGLIKAYKAGAEDAINNAAIIEKIACNNIRVQYSYENMNGVMKVLKDFGLAPISQNFDNICEIDLRVRLSDTQRFIDIIKEQTINITI